MYNDKDRIQNTKIEMLNATNKQIEMQMFNKTQYFIKTYMNERFK